MGVGFLGLGAKVHGAQAQAGDAEAGTAQMGVLHGGSSLRSSGWLNTRPMTPGADAGPILLAPALPEQGVSNTSCGK